MTEDLATVLAAHLADSRCGFSIGSMGAIGEFMFDAGEPVDAPDGGGLTAVSPRGGIRIVPSPDAVAIAYEVPGSRAGRWQHGMVVCRPVAAARRAGRRTLRELGPDRAALRPQDRDGVLFDVGAGARNVDFCVRVVDPALLAVLRRHEGDAMLEPGHPAMAALVETSPHRVVCSALGRVEVFQPIGRVRTPAGPHTHLLPKLLRTGRTHAAGVPVPDGLLSALFLHPPHPLPPPDGPERPFDAGAHDSFQALLERWGDAGYVAGKRRVAAAVAAGGPDGFRPPDSRLGRAAVRIALRQLAWLSPGDASVTAWRRRFDRAAVAA